MLPNVTIIDNEGNNEEKGTMTVSVSNILNMGRTMYDRWIGHFFDKVMHVILSNGLRGAPTKINFSEFAISRIPLSF